MISAYVQMPSHLRCSSCTWMLTGTVHTCVSCGCLIWCVSRFESDDTPVNLSLSFLKRCCLASICCSSFIAHWRQLVRICHHPLQAEQHALLRPSELPVQNE